MELEAVFQYERPDRAIGPDGEMERVIKIFEVRGPVEVDVEDIEVIVTASNGMVDDQGRVDMRLSNIYTRGGHVIAINMPYHRLQSIVKREKDRVRKEKLYTHYN